MVFLPCFQVSSLKRERTFGVLKFKSNMMAGWYLTLICTEGLGFWLLDYGRLAWGQSAASEQSFGCSDIRVDTVGGQRLTAQLWN